MNLLGFASEDFHDAVEDEASGNTIGNAVADGHENAGKEGGNCFHKVVPFHLFERAQHHNTNRDQSWCRSSAGHCTNQRSKEDAQNKESGGGHTGQAGTSACTDTGGALYISGSIGGSENSTDRGSGSVGKLCLVHFRAEALAFFQSLLIFFAEDAGLPAGTNKGADGIKGIRKAESENSHQNQRQLGNIREQGTHTRITESGSKGGGQLSEGISEIHRVCHSSQPHGNTN